MSVPFVWILIISIVLATLSAIASRVIDEMAWHDLEELCKRRLRPERFGKIFEMREQLEFGASVMHMLMTTLAVCAVFALGVGDASVTELTVRQFISMAALIGLGAVVCGTWIPWAVANIGAPEFLYLSWRWWWLVSLITWPLFIGSQLVLRIFQRASGQEETDEAEEEAFEDEILSMVSEAEHDGFLEPDRADMIEGVIDLDDATVNKVMTPRSKVEALDVESDWDAMMAFVVDCGHTRIPVFRQSIDDVVGILFAKDLLKESIRRPHKRRPLEKLIRQPLVVKHSLKLDNMLAEFQESRTHMAIVQDECDGLVGVVTIEDILEEIVGEIEDETDNEQRQMFRVLGPGMAEVDGATPVDTLNERMGLGLPVDREFDTIGGLIMHHVRDIPLPDHELVIEDVHFRIVEANRRSIRRVIVAVQQPGGSD